MLVESALFGKCVACFAIMKNLLVGFIAIQNMHIAYQAYPSTTFKSINSYGISSYFTFAWKMPNI
jgi:hypothetical protein